MEPLSLPQYCYAVHPVTGENILIEQGKQGYYEIDSDVRIQVINDYLQVTSSQVHAMLIGCLYGWEAFAEEPTIYRDKKAIEGGNRYGTCSS